MEKTCTTQGGDLQGRCSGTREDIDNASKTGYSGALWELRLSKDSGAY